MSYEIEMYSVMNDDESSSLPSLISKLSRYKSSRRSNAIASYTTATGLEMEMEMEVMLEMELR